MLLAIKENKRRFERKIIENPEFLEATISYMSEFYICYIRDISVAGAKINITNVPFSLINNSFINLKSSSSNYKFSINARIIYSYKDGNIFQSRIYGVEFLNQSFILNLK